MIVERSTPWKVFSLWSKKMNHWNCTIAQKCENIKNQNRMKGYMVLRRKNANMCHKNQPKLTQSGNNGFTTNCWLKRPNPGTFFACFRDPVRSKCQLTRSCPVLIRCIFFQILVNAKMALFYLLSPREKGGETKRSWSIRTAFFCIFAEAPERWSYLVCLPLSLSLPPPPLPGTQATTSGTRGP